MQPFKNLGYKAPVKVSVSQETSATLPPPSVISDITPFKLAQNIKMQSQIPDCVENGIVTAAQIREWQATGIIPNLSRRVLAIQTVKADGVPFEDGTDLVTGLQISENTGISEVTPDFPDNHELDVPTFIDGTIPTDALITASKHKIGGFQMKTDLSVNGLKNAIAEYGFALIGIKVSDWWWTNVAGQTSWSTADILPIRPIDATHPEVSGHCVLVYGYDSEYFYFLNWWSPEWCDIGHGWFGVNDVPEIYEMGVVYPFVKPTTPAPVDNQVQEVAQPSTFLENLEEEGEKVLAEVESLV